jgi:DNA replication protein DnaC
MNQKTLGQMNALKFYGMAKSFEGMLKANVEQQLTADEMIAALIQAEWEERENRRTARNIKQAKFRFHAAMEQINFSAQRNLDKNMIVRLSDCSFIKRAENILISGPTGIGKTHIANAIGYQACLMGFTVSYFNLQKLFTKLKLSKVDGSYLKEMEKIEKKDLLILDDYGLQKLDQTMSMALLEIIEDRYNKRSLIMASQLPLQDWYDMCDGKTIADAIFDRIINASHKITLNGDSLRKKT